jgi:hypothetical protein
MLGKGFLPLGPHCVRTQADRVGVLFICPKTKKPSHNYFLE